MTNRPGEASVTILGAGAMGCLFGFLLARSGVQVTLVDRLAAEVEAIRRHGLRLHTKDRSERVPVHATSAPADAGVADLVIVCVKAHQTRGALPALEILATGETTVLTVQNGLGAADILSEVVPPQRLLVGTTAQGATQLGAGEVRHGGSGPTVLGPYQGPEDAARRVAHLLTAAGIPAQAVPDPWPSVWKKLAVNCGINALTALTGILNGRIPEITPAATLLADAVGEAAATAQAAGIDLGESRSLVDQVLGVARATAANRSSMGQDVDRRVPTEIEFINGAVVREGERLGVPTPVNRTLLHLVKTLEAGF